MFVLALFIVAGLILLAVVHPNVRSQWRLAYCMRKAHPYERLECLLPYFEDLVHQSSARKAIAYAQALQRIGIIDDCHLAAHAIGEANLVAHQFDTGAAFASCSSACFEGCHHAVMEGYLARARDLSSALDGVRTLCSSVAQDTLLYRQCLHGVGHGILRHGAVILPEAVDLCQRLGDAFAVDTCLGGVFMENVDRYLTKDEKTVFALLPGLCTPITHHPQLFESCIEAVGEGMMFYTGHDLPRSEALCRSLPENSQEWCIAAARQEALINEAAARDIH